MKSIFEQIGKALPLVITLVCFICGCFLMLKATSNTKTEIENSSTIVKATNNQTLQKTSAVRQPAQQKPITPLAQSKQNDSIDWRKAESPSERIKELQRCYNNEGLCGFPMIDPKSEYFAIGQAIKTELLQIQHQALEKKIKTKELVNLAIDLLKTPDGHVKEAALHLLSTQDLSGKALDEILRSVIAYHDASLIALAMLELMRYHQAGFRSKIDHALILAMRTGSPLVGEEVAKHISSFVDENNFSQYQETLSKLQLGSLVYQNLKNVLDDFQMRQNAA